MKIFRLLWLCAMLFYSSAMCADEVFQKVRSVDELNETDTYVICDENSSYAIRKTNGNFLGLMNVRKDDLKDDFLTIDPDKSVVPDEFRLVYVKENVYCIQYAVSGEYLYYDGSSNYLRSKVMSTSEKNCQWTFNTTAKGVCVDCANRKNYFISPYGTKFGVYTQKNDHIKTCVYKKVASKAKQVVVGEAGYVSFVSPAQTHVALPDGLKAYVLSQASAEEVLLTTLSCIPKNTAVILHGKPGTYYLSYAQNASAVEGNLLKVSDGSVKGDRHTIYSLANIGGVVAFYLVGQDVVIPAGKVYLQIDHQQASQARCLTMRMHEQLGVATGEDERLEMKDARRALRWEGLLFRNGRKYLIKRK